MRVLDASMTVAWLLKRSDPTEEKLADKALDEIQVEPTIVPALWYAEVGNSLLRAERAGAIHSSQTSTFLADLRLVEIAADPEPPGMAQPVILALTRAHGLSVYDATYLELAVRTASVLATFDRKLADAARAAGVKVFGDRP